MLLRFDAAGITLGGAGGKGLNLARLSQAGLPAPPGFIIPTSAYQVFTQANGLNEVIRQALLGCAPQDVAGLEVASATIRAAFGCGSLPASLADEILQGYTNLGAGAVAVRSSATAEDLPEMSFAGQQDTYLNIQGSAALLQAVIACWSSLWTARAIGYRARNHLLQADLSLAVIVQQMVPAEASGVMFTANPVSGLRSETVIDATLGLGEALVSGQVEPDQYVVDGQAMKISGKRLGAKSIQTHLDPQGGVRTEHREAQSVQALADDCILALAVLGRRVTDLYGYPQDIEWAWADGKLYLLQARPITSLFPTPQGMPAEPLNAMVSFGAVQGMLDPITPFGRDFIGLIFAVGAHLFGIPARLDNQTALKVAGERLWLNITTPIRNSVGRRIVRAGLGWIEPTVLQALNSIWEEPRLQPEREGIRFHAIILLARFFVPLAGNVLLNLLAPNRRREIIINRGESVLRVLRDRCATLRGDRRERLSQLVAITSKVTGEYFPNTFVRFISGLAAGMASFNLLNVLSKTLPAEGSPDTPWEQIVLEVTRGIPYNPTTQMDLALWQAAMTIRDDVDSRIAFQRYPSAELALQYQSGALPQAAQQATARFLEIYG
ncbi:MAG: PEP/pyruvate-binding domain-containing protein, partial [Anaerolineaceae bacterium]|nr:PEP/pyruvate-binding domain-containing protein [Anaerolineaceae bacterium]